MSDPLNHTKIHTTIQQNLSREQRLQFIRTHLNAFEVKPAFPLQLFEDFVAEVNCYSIIEASCKIEADRLMASRFLLFFCDPQRRWQQYISDAVNFFQRVESRVEVTLNYDLLQTFLSGDFDFGKMVMLSVGIDLRPALADASLKMHIRIKDYPEKQQTASLLAGNSDLFETDEIFHKAVSVIGFDYYLDGRSIVELYPEFSQEACREPQVQALLSQRFSSSVLRPIQASSTFGFGQSTENSTFVLYYQLKDRRELTHYFRLNDTAHRVNSFYQQQSVLPQMWVGVTPTELEKDPINSIRLYYHKHFVV